MISELLVGDLIRASLQEDIGSGDATTSPLIPVTQRAKGVAMAKRPGIIAGVSVAATAFRIMDPSCHIEVRKDDGSRVAVGEGIMAVEGFAAPMLMAERVALNFLQRMSGIATETAKYVEAVRGLRVRIVDTRKTTPGLRALEKYAVRMGGGYNHRFGLYDAVLIKDNHLSLLRARGIGLSEVVQLIKAKAPHTMKIEVEVTGPDQVEQVISAGADAILLDNMDMDDIGSAVKMAKGRVLLEASGGINLGNVREVAGTGVDLISVGAITHSAPSLDISLEIERIEG